VLRAASLTAGLQRQVHAEAEGEHERNSEKGQPGQRGGDRTDPGAVPGTAPRGERSEEDPRDGEQREHHPGHVQPEPVASQDREPGAATRASEEKRRRAGVTKSLPPTPTVPPVSGRSGAAGAHQVTIAARGAERGLLRLSGGVAGGAVEERR